MVVFPEPGPPFHEQVPGNGENFELSLGQLHFTQSVAVVDHK